MWKNNRIEPKNRKRNIFVLLLTGFLLCYMATAMYIGGSVNFREFLSSGRVYDFSERDLQKSSKNWQYSKEEKGYRIQTKKALNKWTIDGRESKWNYLYITIDNLSVPSLGIEIRYYNHAGERIAEQSAVLKNGENIIPLQYNNSGIYKIGISTIGIKGQFFSIKSMQLREKVSGFTTGRFMKIMFISYSGFLAVCAAGFWIRYKHRRRGEKEKKPGKCLELLQYGYMVFLEDICKAVNKKIRGLQRIFLRRLLFSILFLWMTAGNIGGWYKDSQIYRYYMLSVSLLILFIAVLTWEKPLKYVKWTKPLSRAWIILWIVTVMSDIFVVSSYKWLGIVMLLSVGVLFFLWNNMERPEQLLYEMVQALEIDFGVAVLYCMFFRSKLLAIRYNGIYNNSEQFSMYAVLMLSVFLMEIGRNMKKKPHMRSLSLYITGAAVSFYFILRSASRLGYVAAVIAVLVFAIWEISRYQEWIQKLRVLAPYGVKAAVIAFGCVCVVHFSTKYLPAFLGTEIKYEHETLISDLSPDLMKQFDSMEPGLMNGVVSRENIEYEIKWKNYVRRLGMTGSDEPIKVRRKSVPAYSGYIQMMYRYGIFILIPYVMLQIYVLKNGIHGLKRSRNLFDMWLFMVSLIFICFCIGGNVERAFVHPLWFCYYIGIGYWFAKEKD